MLNRVLVTLACVGATAAQSAARTLHVSPQGNDGWAGTADGPFQTLTRARDEVRAMRKAQGLPDGGVVVELGPGTYELSEALALTAGDSGTEAAPVVYRGQQRGTAILSGGSVLTGWEPVTDPVVLELIDAKAKGKVVWIELGTDLLTTIPGFANGGCGFKGQREYPVALFQNNERLPISRWPNGEYTTMGECLGENHIAGHVGVTFTEGIFRYDDAARLRRWSREPDLWFDGLWFHPWADQKLRLQSIDLEARTIALADPASHAFGFKKGQEFFVFNAIGEIDRPGEWVVDRQARRLYLWPAADLAASPVTLSVTDSLIAADGVAHVRFEDLVLENCRRTALVVNNGTHVTVSGSVLRHTGQWGVELSGGSECTVFGCDMSDLGEGGARANGGERASLTAAKHTIENNHIHHFGRIVATYMPGAAVYGVGNRIRHNLIHHAQHQALSFRGNDHLIENNIVHDVCLHSSDAGGLYACARDWSLRGTVIRNNLFHALGEGVDGCGCRAIYLDDMTSGTLVEQNIVTLSDCGLNFGGGKDNVVQSNLALNCVRSINLASRGTDSFAKVDAAKGRDSGCFRKLLRDEKLFRSELWRQRYPSLLAVLDMDPIDAQNAHGNILRNNVNVGGGKLHVSNAEMVMRTCTVESNMNLYEDPGFVDLAGFDLRLRSDAPVLRKLPGFKAPDFANMGLYADARRASAAVKFGAGVTPMPAIQPRIPRPELRPRYIVEKLSGAGFEADGAADPGEWPKTRTPALECANTIYRQPSRFPCTARVGFDGQRLLLFITVDVDPGKPLKMDGKWGGRDGLELALSDTGEDAPVFLIHSYPDATFDVSCPGAVPAELMRALKAGVTCGAKMSTGTWTVELGIPLAALGIEPESFRQLRFNLNVHRTCDDTWTCWWTPKHGITDLESSGSIILPREIPATAEMIRRAAAAKPLSEAEKEGELKWQRLAGWTQVADPDRLGPAAQQPDADSISFSSYSGWAVARKRVTVDAEQLRQPFCALFFPCVDEEGEVYVNGKLAVAHTAQAIGMASGLLWREPFLVDLKRADLAPGAVDIAVHLRGSMGSGGLRKGVFLVWGSTAAAPEPLYDLLAANPKLGWRERVPAFWQDVARERIPALVPAPDEAEFGKHIQRTMDLLASSTPEKRNRVRIFFYGQSITQGMHSLEMINVLRSRFPWAIIDFENRAIGGFGASALVRTGEHDLYPRDADLLIFHVYGDVGSLDTIFSNVRSRNSSDILVYTHHYNWVSDPEKLLATLDRLGKSVAEWHELAATYKLELAPVFRDWGKYLRAHDMGANEVMGDTVHSNVHHNTAGHTLLAKLVLRNFRHHPGNAATYPDAVRTVVAADPAIETVGAWQREPGGLSTSEQGARLKLTFEGNRVDAIALPCASPGTARILIDGKPPAADPELYYCSLPSQGPYIWMPALRRVTLNRDVPPRLETWTLTPFDVDLAADRLRFRLEGTVTGSDGEGDKTADFVSNSGRIKLEKGDFHIIWPCTYRQKDKLPDDYKVTWQVLALFTDPWRVPANVEPSERVPITLVKGLANGSHTLELIAAGDGVVPIREFVVHRPPLRQSR